MDKICEETCSILMNASCFRSMVLAVTVPTARGLLLVLLMRLPVDISWSEATLLGKL